ncbi:tetratricopeptide repeat protein [Photorhabdus heterorhabditis]|uniref:Sel1 repeat family protein n=1 Tax=Photorhabdus heterorhabditis TaxID=880156 RepID=A0A5B0X356_9GAMM|nr:tetratricopeptide repeat protein [Photorhabdus heterorhabditis]KAA1193804.1 sel1 repeat family protein [Photorhabdus heterorhabditis]
MKYIILMMVLLASNVYAENIEKYVPKTVFTGMNYEDKEITLKIPRTVGEFRNLEKLAEKGSADANFLLGRLYSDSALSRSERDYQMAKYYYNKALGLDKNHILSLYWLGGIYKYEGRDKQDVKKAIELYERAGNLGFIRAYNNIAVTYLHGDSNVPQDLEKAKIYFRKMADMGDKESKSILEHWEIMLIQQGYKEPE